MVIEVWLYDLINDPFFLKYSLVSEKFKFHVSSLRVKMISSNSIVPK